MHGYVGFGPLRGSTLDSYHRGRPPERLYPEFLPQFPCRGDGSARLGRALPVHPYVNLWVDPEEVLPNIAYQKLVRHV